jgi:hypothetical protein
VHSQPSMPKSGHPASDEPSRYGVSPEPVHAPAPRGARGRSAARGFITNRRELDDARAGSEVVLVVEGVVRDVEGSAPLAAVVRLDRDVAALARELANLDERLLDVAEAAADRFAARHGSTPADGCHVLLAA